MADSPFFWESVEQARERLESSYLMYGNDPVYTHRIENRGGIPSANITSSTPGSEIRGDGLWKDLADPAFHSFHKLPPLGYVNLRNIGQPTAAFLYRRPEVSRAHGLRNGRIDVGGPYGTIYRRSEVYDFSGILSNLGYRDRLEGTYPTASEIVEKLPNGASAAFSPTFAVSRDAFGNRYLWRRQTLVGTLSEGVTLLRPDTRCYAEELSELPAHDIQNVIIQ